MEKFRSQHLKFVFIDESGDIGLTNTERPYFIIVAVVMPGEQAILMRDALKGIKRKFGLSQKAEFKFSKTRKEVIKDALSAADRISFEYYYVKYDKNKKFNKGVNIYNELMIALISQIKDRDLAIKIDGRYGQRYVKKVKSLVRRVFPEKHFERFGYADSMSDENLQLADLVAGAIARSFSNRKGNQDFIKIIKRKSKSA